MKKNRFILIIIGIFLVILMFVPFIWAIILSFKNNDGIFGNILGMPDRFDFSLYADTFIKGHILNLFKNSLIISALTVAIGMFFTFLSSFSISRLNYRDKKVSESIYYMFLLGTSIPIFVLIIPIYRLTLDIGKISSIFGIDRLTGLLLPYIAMQIAFSTLMYVGGMKGIPIEMEEAGIIDGANLFKIMFRIDLPLMFPVVVALLIFQFLGAWNEFPVASILLNSPKNFTIPLSMAFFKDQYSQDIGAMMRAVVMIMIPQIAFYFIFQKKIIEGMSTAGIKG